METPDGWMTDVIWTNFIGFGREGLVFQAELRGTHQHIAIKCIQRWEGQIVSLKEILDFCRQLKHPNIVRHLHHEMGPSRNSLAPQAYHVIMEFCKGGTLAQAIRRIVVTPYLLQKWTKEIVEGVAYLHEKRYVHRDLKGENILMTSRNLATSSIKIADLSTIASTDQDFPGYGTVPFMAPEMITDRDPETDEILPRKGASVDIWSLGCVVIEMLNGTSPQFFREHDGVQIKLGKQAIQYFVMTGGCPTIPARLPPEIFSFIGGCLKRDPSARSSAADLRSHQFLTSPAGVVSNWVLPDPIGEIEGPAELQEFSVGGQTVIPVKLIRLIGVGAQAKVFLAERTDTNDIVAVKNVLLETDDVIREQQFNVMKAKFQILMALHHPHIVRHIHCQLAPVISAFDPPTYQILMEFCEGPTLGDFVRKTTTPSPIFQKWIKQLVDGLSYLHSQHCVHRDINISNILLSSTDVNTCLIKIGGFGAIKRLQGPSTRSKEVSHEQGTSYCMSPEMITGEDREDGWDREPSRLGRKTDIWNLGCVVIEMITGHMPEYHKKGPDGKMVKINGDMAVMYFIGTGGVPTVPERLPAKLENFITQCIQRHPSDRPHAKDLKRHGFLSADQEEVSNWVLPPRRA